MEGALLDVNDVAKFLRVSPYTIRRWASNGQLQRIKLGSRVLFDSADVLAFVEKAKGQSDGQD